MATSSTTTNHFLKTLAISITTQKPTSKFPQKSLLFKKNNKHLPISLHTPRYFPLFCVAPASGWDQESSPSAVLEDDVDETAVSWDDAAAAAAASAEADVDEVVEAGSGFGADGGFTEPSEEAKLYVGNLPFDVDSERLANMFDAAGVVEIAEVIYNRETDRSRGFGFVTMSTVEEADKAVEMFHSYDLNGRLLTVNKAAPRGSRPERPPREFEPSFRIYVGNLPWDVDNSRLEQLFSEHGKVLSARVVSDRETGRSRGFGFVTMASETEMNDAIAALDGQSLDGRAIRVNVAEERPRRTF
ncbi:hypothetical protein vseg_010342 [Gypsophila vaccaria]